MGDHDGNHHGALWPALLRGQPGDGEGPYPRWGTTSCEAEPAAAVFNCPDCAEREFGGD
jgi:hypothetical protein